MASHRALRRRSCQGKVRYATAGKASAARGIIQHRSYTGPMNIYKCRFCGGYHIGHNGRNYGRFA